MILLNKLYRMYITYLENRNDIEGLIKKIKSGNNKNICLQVLEAIERIDRPSESILGLHDLLSDRNEAVRLKVKFILIKYVSSIVKIFKSINEIKEKKNLGKILGFLGYSEAIKWLISLTYSSDFEDVKYGLNVLENIIELKYEYLETDILQILSNICVFRHNTVKNIYNIKYGQRTKIKKIESLTSKKINYLAKKELDRRSIKIMLNSRPAQISPKICDIVNYCSTKPDINYQFKEKKAILLNKIENIPVKDTEVCI